uniref:Uncharacterized protein n=1 Tax=Aegilops tauschii TaxID=37682 RepID=M8BPS8_AEGTA
MHPTAKDRSIQPHFTASIPEQQQRCWWPTRRSRRGEKRLRRGAPFAGAGEEASKGRENFGAVTKVWGSWASGAKVRVALLVKADLVAEPKTPVAMAAFDGFFSA